MEDFIKREVGDFTFEQLPRKFACVAKDILQGEKFVFDKGPVALAVRVSATFAGIFSPISMGEKLLIDGGVIDNLPVELVRNMGADYVISVDLSSPIKLAKKPSNLVEVTFAVTNLMQVRSVFPDPDSADCYIKPEVGDLSAWTFSASDDLERCGEKAARLKLGQ
jgi:NTE family protein